MKTTSTSNRVTARNGGNPAVRAADLQNPWRWRIATILVPVDFSAASLPAYEFGLDLAEQYNARVHLLHVVENATTPDFEKFPLVRDAQDLIAKVKKELVALAQKGGHPVVPVFPEVRIGSPWHEIVQAAREHRIDLIVIPTHGNTGIKHFVLGSVAERVVRAAPCPVLTVRGPNPVKGSRPRKRNKGEFV
jgi:nucleotide-binding universal stress UspA family protein